MLDHVSISHQSGLILWSKSFTPAFSALTVTPASPINALVKEAFIEGKARSEQEGFEKDGYSVRWTMENGLGLVFVVVFPALLPLTYIPTLLARTKQLFLSLFEPYLRSLVDSLHGSLNASATALQELRNRIDTERWERIFERCLRDCEAKDTSRKPVSLQRQAQLQAASGGPNSSQVSGSEDKAITAEEIAKNVQALKGRMRGKGRGTPSPTSSPKKQQSNSAAQKLMRKWGDSSVTAEDMASLDYSNPPPAAADATSGTSTPTSPVETEGLVSAEAMGVRTANGYEVADWDYRREDLPSEEEILARGAGRLKISDEDGESDQAASGAGRWSSMFSRLTGKKTLTQEDLKPVLAEMEKHLMDKNVAKDISEKLCDSVGTALVGKRLGGLTSVKTEVQNALSASLTRVLTPKTSTDILLEIQRKRASALDEPTPYAMTFVGVNGVGKSTNLSKVCFWLLQNGYRVLIAACDTFRSGAVEQLRVHVRNLGALADDLGEGEKRIALFDRGYGKDASGIAKEAISYGMSLVTSGAVVLLIETAKENKFDVVLIDTAGRMQDNEPLMRALAKLVTVNNPDKIIFVGEALVGNEAVDQLTKFDRALKDFSSAGVGGAQRKRGIDGIILTKFDTIDDKVGAALSMTYVTGQPILFVGCGQTYTDLRHLRVNHIVQALLA